MVKMRLEGMRIVVKVNLEFMREWDNWVEVLDWEWVWMGCELGMWRCES